MNIQDCAIYKSPKLGKSILILSWPLVMTSLMGLIANGSISPTRWNWPAIVDGKRNTPMLIFGLWCTVVYYANQIPRFITAIIYGKPKIEISASGIIINGISIKESEFLDILEDKNPNTLRDNLTLITRSGDHYSIDCVFLDINSSKLRKILEDLNNKSNIIS